MAGSAAGEHKSRHEGNINLALSEEAGAVFPSSDNLSVTELNANQTVQTLQ